MEQFVERVAGSWQGAPNDFDVCPPYPAPLEAEPMNSTSQNDERDRNSILAWSLEYQVPLVRVPNGDNKEIWQAETTFRGNRHLFIFNFSLPQNRARL